ncbi:hypothetical protein C4N18_03625 [Fusobacterium varium ATCC 27725]|uniref:Uncharacterized protein n=1 Tax=Fusobacterium varium ATCC 27725 TaxID=469618 RepID=A0ABM6U248_FUSVA|nr:hypothetical protein C4N18_03625 [Fusobacterium varium ATCC 27725]EES64598.1 hypothetical protein FVAG_01281 [Fusobacterium varium ATCC 27725]VEH37670.1 Uncharacterised protein [Fusobacterium varium]
MKVEVIKITFKLLEIIGRISVGILFLKKAKEIPYKKKTEKFLCYLMMFLWLVSALICLDEIYGGELR